MNIELYNSEFLNFVELNITGDNDDYKRCDTESKFMDTIVFNLFQPCFENANKLFDYFAGTKYNSRKIIVLRNELISNRDILGKINSFKEFIDFVEERFMGKEFLVELSLADKDWKLNWSIKKEKLILVNNLLVELVEKCAFEERILWVIGY